MPERQGDNNAPWVYFAVDPGMDLKTNPIAVEQPKLVESVGVDGRYVGAIRPFPGFADASVHGVPRPSGSTTVTSITNVEFARYVSVQKGISNNTLKGIVYLAQNQAATGKAVYFAYRDSETGNGDVRMLEDFASWVDFKPTVLHDYDFTSMGRYIYFSASADTTTTVASVSGKEAPYNKAYFWDFKVNSWDTFVTGFSQRFMSILPDRILGVLINQPSVDVTQKSSTEAYETAQYVTGAAGSGSLYDLPTGNYTFAAMLLSRKHNLRSKMRRLQRNPIGSGSSLVWRIFRTALISGARQIQNSTGTDPSSAHAWGLSHWDGMRLYRSVVDDLSDQIGSSAIVYSSVNPLHIQENYVERYLDGSLVDDETFKVAQDNITPLNPPNAYALSVGVRYNSFMQDSALVQQDQYDPVLDDFGPAPRMKRIVAYDGMLVGVTDIREPTTLTKEWSEIERYPESIAWSIVTRYPPEPENFPADHIYPLDDPAERVFVLEPAGDYLFAVTNAAVYRMVRSGAQLAINKLQYRMGGVSRFGAVGVGNTLFVLTKTGVKQIDGNTGEVAAVSALDRLIFDEGGWAASLTSVRMAYDAHAGCLILLNTSNKECVFLWEATGAVTKLEQCPWAYVTVGPDVLIDGPARAFFVTSTGDVHVIDANRTMGKRSMCGMGAGETANGLFTAGTTSTSLRTSTATFPVNVVGHKVYVLSGAQIGGIATVTARVSATELTVTGLSGAPAVGDRYSVAPIITRIVWPQLSGQGGGIDPFVAKIGSGLSVAFSNLGGESTSAFGKINMGYRREGTTLASQEVTIDGIPDKCVSRVNYRDTRLFPYVEFKAGNLDFQLQALKVWGQLTGSEAQSRQG